MTPILLHPDNQIAGEWILRSTRVCTPGWIRPADILIRDERIEIVMEIGSGLPHTRVVDAGNHLVLPGLVETHAHINEPGRTDWEGFATATRAAAAGGITTLIDMPLNSSPVTTTLTALEKKRQAATGQIWVDCGFHGGIVPGNHDHVPDLIQAGVCGFKAFLSHSGIDEFPNATEADLRIVMPMLARAGIPLLVHAEIVSPLPQAIEAAFGENPRSYLAYLATRPPAWEIAAIRLMLDLSSEYGCPIHIVHLAAARESRDLLRQAKLGGLPVTVEACPHYLYFAAEDIPNGDPRFKCAPPIRERCERDTLRDMVLSGEIDTLGSDHSPAPPDLKHLEGGDLRRAWGGIASLQLLLPAVWSALKDPREDYPLRIASLLSRNPARLAGLADRKGAIAPGMDADLVIFDPDGETIVTEASLHHRHKATPYLGKKLRGQVLATYLRGQRVFDRGDFDGGPRGRLVERSKSRVGISP